MDDTLPGFDNPYMRHAHGSDDDPDEEDIEDHLMDGHPTLFGRRTIYRDPEASNDGNRGRTEPGDANAIMSNFQQLLQGIGGGPRPSVGRSGPEQLFPSHTEDAGPPRVHYTRFSSSGLGNGGVTTFTFSTSGGGTHTTVRSGSPMGAGMNPTDPFQAYVLSPTICHITITDLVTGYSEISSAH